MEQPSVVYLTADVVAHTGISESYLAFLVREGIVRPLKHRNGWMNLFTEGHLTKIEWILANRGRCSLDELRTIAGDPMSSQPAVR
jgi:DNA-binding transcriptional MerR regulator